jgi:hypothetical protein
VGDCCRAETQVEIDHEHLSPQWPTFVPNNLLFTNERLLTYKPKPFLITGLIPVVLAPATSGWATKHYVTAQLTPVNEKVSALETKTNDQADKEATDVSRLDERQATTDHDVTQVTAVAKQANASAAQANQLGQQNQSAIAANQSAIAHALRLAAGLEREVQPRTLIHRTHAAMIGLKRGII